MSLRSILLPLSLFVCAAAFAAPPVVTFEADGVYAAVPAGHTVAWNTSGVGTMKAGLVADSDNDGRVKLAATLYRAWAVFDVESAEWTTGGAPASGLPPRSIVRGPAGDFSVVYPPYPVNEDYGIPLWVRPGVGAWTLPNGYGAPSTVIWRKTGGILDATKMSPLGNSPATPGGFEDGDYLFLVNPLSIAAGLVDPRLDDSPSAGAFYKQTDESTAAEASKLNLNIVRIGGTTGTVSVRCDLSGTAQAGIDYAVPASAIVTFGPGETIKAFSLQLLDDGAFNLDPRQVDVNLTDPTGGATVGGNWPTTIALTDDDPRPILSLGSVPASVPEGDVTWNLDVPVHITNAFRGSLPVTLRNGGSGVDYLTALTGQSDVTAQLPIYANDNQADPDRTYTISIVSPYADTAGGTRTITVVDDDPPPVLIDDARAFESDSVYFPMRSQWSPADTGTVSWKTVDGTAKAGQDYAAASGTTTISTYSSIAIALMDDDAAEGPEVFYIDVTGISGPLLPPTRTRYQITIIDDDELPSGVIVEPVTVVEGDITKSVPLRVKLASPSQSRITLRIGTTDKGTATQFKDYGGGSLIVFQPGETEKDAAVTVYGEEEGEPDEVGEITILDKTFTKVLATTTITILDDDMDTTPVVSLSAPSPAEGNGGQTVVPITVRLAYALPVTVTMAIGSRNGTASSTDYVPLAEGIKFLAGETEKEVGLTVIGDKLVEGDETVLIEVMRTGRVIASMTLTILDDDSASSPSLVSIADVNVVEKTGENVQAAFRVTVTPPPTAASTVKYTTEIGTAGGADFASTSGTLSFAAGQSTADILVPVFGDAIVEADERFSVRLFDANGVTLSDDRGFATILDDDDPVVRPVLSVEDVAVTESNEQTFAEVTLRLSQATSASVRISVETVDGTATVNGDYERRAVTLTFAPGQTTKTLSIPITGDTVHEETETFTVRLFDGSGMIVPDLQATTCTITDDDASRAKRRTTRH